MGGGVPLPSPKGEPLPAEQTNTQTPSARFGCGPIPHAVAPPHRCRKPAAAVCLRSVGRDEELFAF